MIFKLRLTLLLFIASLSCFAQVAPQTAASVDNTEVVAKRPPLSSKELLEKIRNALAQDSFLNQNFYDAQNLSDFFGEPYIFKPLIVPKALNVQVISFDSPQPQDSDQSTGAIANGEELPVLKNGKVYLSTSGNNQLTSHFVINPYAATVPPNRIDADLVIGVFGKPTSVKDNPPPEKNDDTTDSVNENTRPLGNSWLNYQTESGDIFRTLLFRTAGDAEVVEIQIYTGKKQ